MQHFVAGEVLASEELLATLFADVVSLIRVHLDVSLQVAAGHVRCVAHRVIALERSLLGVSSASQI